MAKKNASVVQISRKGMMVWGGLVIFISVWMFILGIMVGRGSAPVQLDVGKLERELAALKAKMQAREQAKAKSEVSGKGGEAPDLGFYEALKAPQKQETPFKAPSLPSPQEKPVSPKPLAKKMPPPKPAPKPRAKAAAPVKPKTAPEPVAGSVAAKGRFAIQVAAVQNARSAENLVARLRNKGYRAYQIRCVVEGKGVWYRIRVGAYEERGQAQKELARLKADNLGGMVVHTK